MYINQATNNTAVAVLYVIATCGSLFFSKIKMMVAFGAANLAILLVVMEVKRYAFRPFAVVRLRTTLYILWAVYGLCIVFFYMGK